MELTRVVVNAHPLRAATLEAFVDTMETRLTAHDEGRGPAGWRGDSALELFGHLVEEVTELEKLLHQGGSNEEFRLEAADIANMAMMVADAIGALPR